MTKRIKKSLKNVSLYKNKISSEKILTEKGFRDNVINVQYIE